VHPFSFPFRSLKDVRSALTLRFRPLLSGEEAVEIIPWISGVRAGGAEGAAWCLAASDVPGDGTLLQGNICWPLPLALASMVDGEGIAVFRGMGVIASAVFSGGVPVFSRCAREEDGPVPEEGDAVDREVRLCREIASASGKEGLVASVWTGTSPGELLEAARQTSVRFPAFLNVNISRPALEAALARERTARVLRNFSAAAAFLGAVFCAVQFSLSLQVRSSLDSLSAGAAALYREIAGPSERIVDPLSQARGKLAELRGSGGDDSSLSLFLAHLGRVWTAGEGERKSGFPVLDQMRYTGESAELTGTAQTMEAIQALRAAADSRGFRASLGDIQQIPGGGLRFSLSLRRDRP
jgi:hypothetical protein